VNSDADAKVYQSLTAKLQYSEDFANETYLGLTTTIIEKSLQKICGSSEDYIDAEHRQIMLTHLIKPKKTLA
jgi:Fe(3+) dicitrate transport protein